MHQFLFQFLFSVIQSSKIVDQGRPQELLERAGFYRDGNASLLNSMTRKIGYKFIVGEDGKLRPVEAPQGNVE